MRGRTAASWRAWPSQVGRGVVVVALIAGHLSFAGPASAQGPDGLTQTGLLGSVMSPTSRYLAIDPGVRRLFEVGEPADDSASMRVAAYDLDSLGFVGSIDVPSAQSAFGGRVWTLDAAHHRLFILHPVSGAADPNILGTDTGKQFGRTVFGISVIDTATNTLLGTRAVPEIAAVPHDLSIKNQIGVKAMLYHPPEDKLYLATENTSTRIATIIPGDRTVTIHRLDATKLLDSSEATVADWSYPLPQCATVMHSEEGGVLLHANGRPELFVPCATGGVLGVPPPLDTGGIVRLRMTPGSGAGDVSRFGTDFYPMAGRLEAGIVAADAAPGIERLFLRVDATSTGGQSGIWVFDAGSVSWLGAISTPGGAPSGMVVDEVHGRLYSLSGGLPEPELHTKAVLATTRTQLADQGVVFEAPLTSDPLIRRPLVDPVTHRLFWESADGYLIFEDRFPILSPPPPPDPDGQTTDIEEGPGTGVNFLGSSRAYGSRLRMVGGWRGGERNVNTVMEDDPKNFVKLFLPADRQKQVGEIEGSLPPDPQGGTRDHQFGRVLRTTLSNGEASGEAIGADRDIRNTDTDLANWTSYIARNGGPDLTGERWPYEVAQCTDFGGDPGEENVSGAAVVCRRQSDQVIASAVNEGPWNTGPVFVGESRAQSFSIRDPERGIVSVSTAEAKGVDIAGLVGIGRIMARAETWAKGRPGTAGSSYVRQFQDVWFTDGDQRRIVCGASCDPRQIEQAFTTVLSSRVQVTFPSVDAGRAEGTPGGFEALVVRDAFEQANDIAVNDETDVRLEVPAVEITLVADGRVRSRVVASFAAVAAESHYGIFLLGDALPAASRGSGLLGAPASVGSAPVSRAASPAIDDADAGRLPYPSNGNGLGSLVRQVFDGLRFFLASPGHIAKAAVLWTILASPLFLWMRRRSLDALGVD